MANDFDEQEAANKAAQMGKNATEADVQNVQQNMGKMNKGALAKIWDKVVSLWEAFKSPSTPTWMKGTIIGALIYMVSPLDLVPDVIPFAGLLDDASVIGFAFSQLVRLGLAGAAGAGVATIIKVARLSVDELKKRAKQIDSRAMSAKITECIKKNNVNYVKIGLLDADGTEINTMEIEADKIDTDICVDKVYALVS